MSMLYAIGDIHGYPRTLEALVEKMGVRQRDRIVFLGDYIDRGPDPRGVIDYIIYLQESQVETICLMGNHESMWIDFLQKFRGIKILKSYENQVYLDSGDYFLHAGNGGNITLSQYQKVETEDNDAEDEDTVVMNVSIDIPDSHIQFFKTLKPFYVESSQKEILFVHAGLSSKALKKKHLNDAILEDLTTSFLSNYSPFIHQRGNHHLEVCFDALIVHGHTPIPLVCNTYIEKTERDSSEEKFHKELEATLDTPGVVKGKLNLDGGVHHYADGKILGARFVNGAHVESFSQVKID